MSDIHNVLSPSFLSCQCLHPTRAVTSLCIGIINPNPHALIGSSTASLCVIGLPQDHSGHLQAEEFKACLISLGYDVETDKQVWACPEKKGLQWLLSVSLCVCVSVRASTSLHSFHHSLTPSLTCAAAWNGALCRSTKVLLFIFYVSHYFLFSFFTCPCYNFHPSLTCLLYKLILIQSNSVCVQPLHPPKFSAFHMHPSCFFSHPSLCEL